MQYQYISATSYFGTVSDIKSSLTLLFDVNAQTTTTVLISAYNSVYFTKKVGWVVARLESHVIMMVFSLYFSQWWNIRELHYKVLSKSSQVTCAGLLQERKSIQRKSTTFYCKYIYTAVKRRSRFNQREWKCWQKCSSKSLVWCYFSFIVWPKKHQLSPVIRLSSQEKKRKNLPQHIICANSLLRPISTACFIVRAPSSCQSLMMWAKGRSKVMQSQNVVKVGVDGWVQKTFEKTCAFWTNNPDTSRTWLWIFFNSRFCPKPTVCFVPMHNRRC